MRLRTRPDGPTETELSRLAVVAAITDTELVYVYSAESVHSELLHAAEFARYADDVWALEDRGGRLLVKVIETLPPDEAAVFATTDANGVWRSDGPVLYVKTGHQRRLTALHEIAHLLVDDEGETCGHGEEWLTAYIRLQRTYFPRHISNEWAARREQRIESIAADVARDPNYLPPAVLQRPQ